MENPTSRAEREREHKGISKYWRVIMLGRKISQGHKIRKKDTA